MKKTNKTNAGLLTGVLLICAVSQGAIITDDFNRSDTIVAYTNVESVIGNGWVNGSPDTTNAGFRISNNEIDVAGSVAPFHLVNTVVGTINDGENNSFTMSGDFKLGVAAGNFVGLLINFQDVDNYYMFRMSGTGNVQLVRVVDGSVNGTVLSQSGVFTPGADTWYRMSVSSSTPYSFDLSIVDIAGGTNVFSASVTDTLERHKDGLGGFYCSSNVSFFDNYRLEHRQFTLIPNSRIADYFSRADTVQATNNVESIIGSSWSNASSDTANSRFRIYNNEIDVVGTVAPFHLVNTAVGTVNDGENNRFAMSGDFKLGVAANNFVGLLVNYQDDGNYYQFRMSGSGTVQLVRYVDGSINGTVLNQSAVFTPDADTWYRMSVSSSTPYSFDLSIVDNTVGTNVFSASVTDALERHKDGLGGFYSSSAVSFFDNFDLTRITDSTIVDDFNRVDTALDTDFSVSIGSGWISGGDLESTSRIFSNAVDVSMVDANTPLGIVPVNTELETLNDGAYTDFVLSATVWTDATNNQSWAGMVFNWQDTNNCYLLRFSGAGGVQLLRRVDGDQSVVLNVSEAFAYVANRPYELTVSSADPYLFDISIKDTVADTVVYSADSVLDINRTFKDGYGGFYAYTVDLVDFGFDDYNLAVSQMALPPVEGSAYEQWAAGFGIAGAATDDDDGDGLSNLAEYALDGNPTNALDLGEAPSLTVGGLEASYVFPQRSDDTTLTYTVKTTDDLVGGVWTNTGISVIDTNVTGSTLDYVTNSVSTDVSQRFIKLEVQQN